MREPNFWDDEARYACGVIFATNTDEAFVPEPQALRYLFDRFIDNHFEGTAPQLADTIKAYWRYIGSIAIRIADKRGTTLTPDSVTEVLIRKQRDYGHKNIQRFGRTGLMIRCHDKIARLENLCGVDFEPNNESIDDTLLDVVGYSAIGIMWENQTFLLPLAPPKNLPEMLANGEETR